MIVNSAAYIYIYPCFLMIPSPDGYRISLATSRDMSRVSLQFLNKN